MSGTRDRERVGEKKVAHDFALARSAEDLTNRLIARGIDVLAMAEQLLIPGAEFGAMFGGSIPEGTATPVSDLDVLILLDDPNSFVHVKQISGRPVFMRYPNLELQKNWVVLFCEGVEVNFEFKVNTAIGAPRAARFDPDLADDSPDQLRFLGRLASGWSLRGHEIVDRWRRHYDIDALVVRRVVSEFTLAAKELEDMQAAIGGARGLNAYLGSHIVAKLLRSLLATHGYFSIGEKWLRKVDQLIRTRAGSAELLERGRNLMFPSLHDDEANEVDYFRSVLAYTREVQEHLSSSDQLRLLLQWTNEEFDTINGYA